MPNVNERRSNITIIVILLSNPNQRVATSGRRGICDSRRCRYAPHSSRGGPKNIELDLGQCRTQKQHQWWETRQ